MDMTAQGNSYNTQMMGQQLQNQGMMYNNTPLQQPYYRQQPQIQNCPKICDFVQGDLGATIYQINFCNQEATLIDADDSEIVYRKSRDVNGKLSPVQKFKLVPIEERKQEEIDMSNYVKTDEILDIISDTVKEAVEKELNKKLSEISFKPESKEGK